MLTQVLARYAVKAVYAGLAYLVVEQLGLEFKRRDDEINELKARINDLEKK